MWWLAVLALFSLRLFPATWSFWLDEAIQWQASQSLGFYLTNFAKFDFNPPLFYFLTYLWQRFLPDYLEIDFILRLIPVTIFLILFFSFYFNLKSKLGLKQARLAGFLLLTSPLLVYYSSEYRSYILTALIAFWLWWYWRWFIFRQKLDWPNLVYMVIFLVLSLLTHYSLVFLVLAMFLISVTQDKINRKQIFLIWLAACLAFGLIWGRIFYLQWLNSQTMLNALPNWSMILGSALVFKQWLFILVKFTLGRISFEPKLYFYIIGSILSAPFWLLFIKGTNRDKPSFYLFSTTLAIAFIHGLFGFGFSFFRFLYLVPVFIYLIVLGLKSVKRQALIFVYLFLVQLTAVFILISQPKFFKEDWRQAVTVLNHDPQPAVLVIPNPATAPLEFYHLKSDYQILDPSQIEAVSQDKLYHIDYAKFIFNDDDHVQKLLDKKAYNLIRAFKFNGTQVELDLYQKQK